MHSRDSITSNCGVLLFYKLFLPGKCEKWDVKRKRGQEEGREWIGKEKMNKLHAAGESHEKNRD